MTTTAGTSKIITPINQSEIMNNCIRYAILIVLMIIVILNMNNVNIQFISFIIELLLIIIGGTFIVKDLVSSQEKMNNKNPVSIFTINKTYTNIFMFAVIFGILLKIISMSLFILVFSYGRSQIKSNSSSLTLTSDNQTIFNRFFIVFIISSLLIGVLAALIFIGNTSPEVRYLVINITSLILTISVLGLTGYETYSALKFFNVYKNNGIVYKST
jgi:hypothetical protein